MESIRSLEQVGQDILKEAFQEAFKYYEMQMSQAELLRMLHRRGYNPQLSFGAFSGEKLVSFTFNGTGSFTNQFTAYDTGTGTIEEFRVKGLASLLLLEVLKSHRHDSVKAINYQTDDRGFAGLIKSFGNTLKGQQFEMIKQLL